MNWDLIFTITNNYALLMWLILAFATRRAAILTGLFYGGSGESPDFSTLTGVQQLLSTPGGATVGWIHYLAFDLFVGLWVARNADKYGFARWLQIPILLFVLMLGPLGLVLYLLLRFTRHNKVADAVMPE